MIELPQERLRQRVPAGAARFPPPIALRVGIGTLHPLPPAARIIPAAGSYWTPLQAHDSALWNPPAPTLFALVSLKKKKERKKEKAEP